MTYCFIKRVKIGPAQLLYSSVPENDAPLWGGGVLYGIDATVISTVTHRVYRSVRDNNVGHDPTLDAGAGWWQDIAPTNRWAMFDDKAGTFTTSPSTPFSLELQPGIAFDSIALLDIAGGSTATIEALNGATATIYQASVQISSTGPSKSWWEYFTVTGAKPRHMIVADLPSIPATARLRITFDGSSIGTLVVGTKQEIGRMLVAPKLGVKDYSKKTTDEFGAVSLVERAYSRTLQAQFQFDNYFLDGLYAALGGARATPSIFFDSSLPYESFTLFGYYTDLGVDVAYRDHSVCSLYLESMT